MANGTLLGGRAVDTLSGGRAVATSWASNDVGWPRTGAMCAPVQPCCCKGPWEIGLGETLPVSMLWQRWIDSVPGYTLNKVTEASLLDVNVNPERPADPEIIKLVTGTDEDEEPTTRTPLISSPSYRLISRKRWSRSRRMHGSASNIVSTSLSRLAIATAARSRCATALSS